MQLPQNEKAQPLRGRLDTGAEIAKLCPEQMVWGMLSLDTSAYSACHPLAHIPFQDGSSCISSIPTADDPHHSRQSPSRVTLCYSLLTSGDLPIILDSTLPWPHLQSF